MNRSIKIFILLQLALFTVFTSCKSPKVITETEIKYEYITQRDTVTNTLKVVDSIPYPVEKIKEVRLTRQERKALKDSMRHVERMYRLMARTLEDSLKHVESMYEYKLDSLEAALKHETRQNRSNNRLARNENRNETQQKRIEKRNNWWFWLLLGVVLGVIGKYILKRLKDRLKSYLF